MPFAARALLCYRPFANVLVAALASVLPTLANAHEGAHLHPHGVELWWVVAAAAIGALGGWLAASWRGRR